jgi:transcriptional regulator with XRE-family HTH domain
MDNGLLQKYVAAMLGVSENTITYWENGRSTPQIHYYPQIFKFLNYYPFNHETDNLAVKLLQVRNCHGQTCKQIAQILGVDTATVSRWEKGKSQIKPTAIQIILKLWMDLPNYVRTQHLSL